jgi:hypothetical protein
MGKHHTFVCGLVHVIACDLLAHKRQLECCMKEWTGVIGGQERSQAQLLLLHYVLVRVEARAAAAAATAAATKVSAGGATMHKDGATWFTPQPT